MGDGNHAGIIINDDTQVGYRFVLGVASFNVSKLHDAQVNVQKDQEKSWLCEPLVLDGLGLLERDSKKDV